MAFENPAAYTEVDPSSQLSSSGNKFIFTGLTRDASTYYYKDWGVDFWSGDFSFKFKAQATSGDDAGMSHHVTVANAVDDLKAIFDDVGENALTVRLRNIAAGALNITLIEIDAATVFFDNFVGADATDYWCQYKRVGGTLSLLIYSDEFITLVDTLTVVLQNTDSFRYLYPIQSWNDGSAVAITGFIEEIDLGLAVISGFPFFFDAGHY